MGFCGSSQLKVIDLSHNLLVGSVPKCLDYVPRYLIYIACLPFSVNQFYSHLHFLRLTSFFIYYRSSFEGNCLKDKDPKQRPAAECGMCHSFCIYITALMASFSPKCIKYMVKISKFFSWIQVIINCVYDNS